jgi:putative heme-binding domain-containing protein
MKLRNLDHFDQQLADLSRKENAPADLRIASLECLAGRRKQMGAAALALLTHQLSEQTEPLLRIAAARTLGTSALDAAQLRQLAEHMAGSGTMVIRLLLPAFARSNDVKVGKKFVQALKRSVGAEALSLAELDQALRSYPEEVQALASHLRDKLKARQKQQAAYLAGLTSELGKLTGNADSGRSIFFSRKIGCYGCHRLGTEGGNVGPDLSHIGRFRSRAELLESVVFPSFVIVPEFRSFTLTTRDGKQTTGLIVRESVEALHLRTADLAEVRIAREDIDELTPSTVSLMPDGLEKLMSRQELSDLLEFLVRQQ